MPSARATSLACKRPCSAERQQTVVARIVTALHRNGADGPHHIGRYDLDDAERRALDWRSRAARQCVVIAARAGFAVERHASADQARRPRGAQAPDWRR